jgi:RHS repeat-associated protein
MAGAQTEVVEYYGLDALGSVRVVFDGSGVVVARSDYLPFGENLNPSGALPPWQFTGQVRDGEAGQDDFGARRYQPRHGRFTAVDPVYAGLFDPQQWNRYGYARNSPLVFVDPDGRQFRIGVECQYPGGAPGCPFVGWGFGLGLLDDGSPGRFNPQPNRDHRPNTPGGDFQGPRPAPPPLTEDNGSSPGNNGNTNGGQNTGDEGDDPTQPTESTDCSFTRRFSRHFIDTNRVIPGLLAPTGLSLGLNAKDTFNNALFRLPPERPYGVLSQFRNVAPTGPMVATRLAVTFFAVGIAYEAGVVVGSAASAVIYSCP